MGTYLKQYDKDYMKMAILKQEETFRQQVHELHRLYKVQKLLMNDTKAEISKRQRKSSSTRARNVDRWNAENETDHVHQQSQGRARKVLNLELPAEEYIEEESDLELTLATGGSRRRKNAASSFTSDSGASFSSSSTESGGVKLNGNEWGLFQVPDVNIGSYPRNKFNAEEQMISEERVKRPPWLVQCLSLNMT